MTLRRTVTGAALTAAAYHVVPSVTALRRVRLRAFPALSGVGASGHVALTFDDGPDPRSTPHVLDVLRRLDVRATFFTLGASVTRHPDLARRIVSDGHEIALHGWQHQPCLLTSPWDLWFDTSAAIAAIVDATGVRPQRWRPPHGIWSGPALTTAWALHLQPVLWTSWGHDWGRALLPGDVIRQVRHTDHEGASVLLHDADWRGRSQAWCATVAALPPLVTYWRATGRDVGPLRDHLPRGTHRAHSRHGRPDPRIRDVDPVP